MPIISKLLTRNDIDKSLLIPTDSFSIFSAVPFEGGRFFNMPAIDETGKPWDFPCFVQQSEGVVSIGWLEFARGKDVRVGDVVFLHHESIVDDDDSMVLTQLTIQVKRKIRLLGEDIWAVLH